MLKPYYVPGTVPATGYTDMSELLLMLRGPTPRATETR